MAAPRLATLALLAAACLPLAIAAARTPDTARARTDADQGIDPATLARYHHTDQGTRLIPAAWLQALKTADGSTRVMDSANTAKFGFLPDEIRSKLNPYGWPIGFTVSDPSQGIPIAGITCAACHTGQLDYRGRNVRIEGGQAMVDLPAFDMDVLKALGAVANDPQRKSQFFKDGRSYKNFEILLIPRKEGELIIPPIVTSVFNPKLQKYQQLETPEFKINVLKGAGQQAMASSRLDQGAAEPEDTLALRTDWQPRAVSASVNPRLWAVLFGLAALGLLAAAAAPAHGDG